MMIKLTHGLLRTGTFCTRQVLVQYCQVLHAVPVGDTDTVSYLYYCTRVQVAQYTGITRKMYNPDRLYKTYWVRYSVVSTSTRILAKSIPGTIQCLSYEYGVQVYISLLVYWAVVTLLAYPEQFRVSRHS